MSVLNCTTCNIENRNIAKYCRFCGKMISQTATTPLPVSQTTANTEPQSSTITSTTTTAPAAVNNAPDYIGHEDIRSQLGKIKSNILFQKKRQEAGVGGSGGAKIFVFRGKTGAGKTLVAKHFIEDLRQEDCLSSDRVTNKEARELSKTYGDEYAIAKFLSESKPAALVVDNATENTTYIHELILALSKSTEECICIIIGNNEGFEEFFKKHVEDRQRITYDFDFNDLSLEDLTLILMKKLNERGLCFEPNIKKHFTAYIRERLNDQSCEYKNGWLVEKGIIPAIDKNQQARLESLVSC